MIEGNGFVRGNWVEEGEARGEAEYARSGYCMGSTGGSCFLSGGLIFGLKG